MEERKDNPFIGEQAAKHVTILVFGIARDITGGKSFEIEKAFPCTLHALQEAVLAEYPAFLDLNSLKIAVNAEYVPRETLLTGNEEFALIPPVSGG